MNANHPLNLFLIWLNELGNRNWKDEEEKLIIKRDEKRYKRRLLRHKKKIKSYFLNNVFKELIEYVLHPKRICRMADKFHLDFDEYLESI